MSRAFERPLLSVNSSKRTESLKQKTIYRGLVNQSISRNLYPTATANQWEKKGSINYTFTEGSVQDSNGTATDGAGCLKAAHSYELLLDASKGKSLANPILTASVVGASPSWIAPFIEKQGGSSEFISRTAISGNTIIYDAGGIPNPLPMEPDFTGDDSSWNPTNFPGYVIGKDYIINPCVAESVYLNTGDVSLNVTYKWTSEYWKVAQTDKFASFQYPKTISLQQQQTELSSEIIRRKAPQPAMDVSDSPPAQLERYCTIAT